MSDIDDILCCPRCRAALNLARKAEVTCGNAECDYATLGFPRSFGQLVLVDFTDSIFDRTLYRSDGGTALPRDASGRSLGQRINHLLSGNNEVAAAKAEDLLARIKTSSGRPRILVIGGGTVGLGAQQLYRDPDVDIVGIDAYASPHTRLVADAHRLPFADSSFDAVWIQAVLEHVLEPHKVVDEIFRVLKIGGIVFADTPFMQQVHEEAYDFTRFTASGHRWLFRRFTQIDAGTVGGAGTALLWSLQYFVRSLAGDRLAKLFVVPLFWIRYGDRLSKGRANCDAAAGVFFYGVKSTTELHARDMIAYYEQQNKYR